MRFAIALVLLVGCAEGMSVGDAPAPGGAHGDGAAAGADGGQTCTAALETLNGNATYVKGSAAATDPAAMPIAQTGTCGDWVPAHESTWDGLQSLQVVGGQHFALVGSAPAPGGCLYTLRLQQDASGGDLRSACAVSLDYQLVVP